MDLYVRVLLLCYVLLFCVFIDVLLHPRAHTVNLKAHTSAVSENFTSCARHGNF